MSMSVMSSAVSQHAARAKARLESRVAGFAAREDGATMVEYGLMVALIAVVCIAGVTLLGGSVAGIFNKIAGSVAAPA